MSKVLRAVGTLVCLLGVVVLTLLAFRLPLGPSLHLLVDGAFGDKFAWSRTVVKATPLLFTGLGMVVAWRGGAYNIGGEGQFVIGGLCGACLARFLISHGSTGPGASGLILAATLVGGAGWAGLAGWLQVRRGVEAVISTILLNFVALQILGWAVEGPLQEPRHQLPQTITLPDSLMLFRSDRQMDLNIGCLIALVCAAAVFLYLFRTAGGFQMRLAGDGPGVARANRIDANRTKLQAFLISGALCGLAGGVEYVGTAGLIGSGFSQNWGFLGIPVALLSGLNPLAAIGSAFYFGALMAGSENLGRFTQGGPTLVYVVQGAAVLAFVGIGGLRQLSLRSSTGVEASIP